MFASVLSFYFFIKIVFFYSLVRAQIKSDLIKDNWLFLGIFYTGTVAFLSFALIKSWDVDVPWARWVWAGPTGPEPGHLELSMLAGPDAGTLYGLFPADVQNR